MGRIAMKEGKTKIRDGSIFYRHQGEGDALILIHSMGLSSELWSQNMEQLSNKFSVYAIDLLGHGDSDKPDLNYEVIDHARSLIEFLDALNINKARVIGSSIGALISIDMATQFPDRIEKQVLVACPVHLTRWESLESLMWLALRYDRHGNPIPQTVEQMKFLYVDTTQEIADWTNDLKNKAGQWCKKDQIALALWEIGDKFEKIRCPTLTVYGTEDLLLKNEKIFLDGIASARGIRIEGSSHFPQKEKPEAFNDAVLEFL
jgi:pimeloyl-ACP methyl ester carboxylesterase